MRRLDRAAGLKFGHCQQIVSGGIRSVHVETVDKLARATGSTLAWLIRGEGRAPDLATVRALVQQSCGDEVDGDDLDAATDAVLADQSAAPEAREILDAARREHGAAATAAGA